MNPEREGAPDPGEEHGSLLLLVLLACVVGAGAGAIGTLFRLCLEHADAWRDALIGWAHVAPIVGFVLVTAGCASAVALAAWLVRRFSPEASGSGIPHVEAVLRQDVPPAPLSVLPVSRMLYGDAPDFHVGPLAFASAATIPLYVALGAVAGLVAVGYNRAILGAIAAANDLRRWPLELRAGAIGAAVGALAWFAPDLVGGGDPLTQRALNGSGTLVVLPLILLLRFGLGAVSYAAGTPGGLFAPLLVIGAQLGLCFGLLCRMAFPGLDIAPQGFAVVGMAAFFAGVVRAPLTGITLVVEMTANVTMLLPMLGACFVAMLVPTLLRNPPIYDSLREQGLRRDSTR
jgi:H+/Cl- antiporter ClcA